MANTHGPQMQMTLFTACDWSKGSRQTKRAFPRDECFFRWNFRTIDDLFVFFGKILNLGERLDRLTVIEITFSFYVLNYLLGALKINVNKMATGSFDFFVYKKILLSRSISLFNWYN